MGNGFKILDWDSKFFGYKIASIKPSELKLSELKKIVNELKPLGVKLVYCFVSPEDEKSNTHLRKFCGLPVDEKITFSTRISGTEIYMGSSFIKPYDLNYASEKLKSIALQSGIYSRFKIDPKFKNNEYEKLYTEWIERSIRREIAVEVLVYREDEDRDEKGMITLGLEENTGSIGLLAVDSEERGKSIGKKLVQSAFIYFREKRVNIVEVVTQAHNKGACGFYRSMGFEVKSIVNIYHLWIN
jgi:dTDP-4-amino-4,6-dideoxy-D-galactose acyltransferase